MEIYIFVFTMAAYLLYYFYTTHQNVKCYEDQGMVYLGNFYFNLIKTFLRGEHLAQSVTDRYNKVKAANQKFGFEFELGKPSFFINDLELLKQITIGSFEYFANPFTFADTKNHNDLIGRMLVSLRGEKWKAMRSIFGPTFSNAKLKRVFHIMDSTGKKLVNYWTTEISPEGGIVNMEKGLSKFTMDFVAASAFGVDTKVFENREQSIFEKMAGKVRLGSARVLLQMAMLSICPYLSDLFTFSIIEVKAQNFFRNIVMNTIRVREQNKNHKANDFIDLMLEARTENIFANEQGFNETGEVTKPELPLEDEDIVANSLSFFLGGFDTVQNTLQVLCYNMALWPEVQERLFQELKQAVRENNEEFNYEIINKLEYLNGVVSESMRMCPASPVTLRTCTKDFLIPETSIWIPKGSTVVIPIAPIQNDPTYFANPKEFNPDRFSLENRSTFQACSYMPFGLGPRMCLGNRLAYVELKTAVAHIILNFMLEPCKNTQIPMQFDNTSVITKPAGGLSLKLTPRS